MKLADAPYCLAAPLVQLLEQLHSVLRQIDTSHYTRQPVGSISGSLGGHIRHCLDHVRSLLDSLSEGRLNYDLRRRDTEVERDPIAARQELLALMDRCLALDDSAWDRPVELTLMLAADAEPVAVRSTFGREMAYVLAHTIHHNAILGAILATLGYALPPRFGYAPSTIAYQQTLSCAR